MRKLIRHFIGATLAVVALAPCCASLVAGEPTGDDLLQGRGLSKVGPFYLLESDAKLPESMRSLRQAKGTVEANSRKRAQVEREVKNITDQIISLERQYQDINQQIAATKRKNDRIPLEAQRNTLASKIREAALVGSDREKDLEKISDSRDDYVGIVLELSDRLEAASKQYEALAKEAKIKAAIDSAGAAGAAKMRLGPSPGFVQELPFIRKERQSINASVVKFNIQGGVPHVLATLNGASTQTMVFDSGASLVTLNADVARQLTLTAPAKETTVKLQDAKGTLTDAKVMILKSIRVGQYTVEDVECAVMPESSHGSNLLGGTFLRHFIYRMDLSSGELHLLPREAGRTKMTPVLPEVAKGTPAGGSQVGANPQSPTPAARPDVPATAPQGSDEWVDLLPLVELKAKPDGKVTRDDSGILYTTEKFSEVSSGWIADGSYEIQVRFTSIEGSANGPVLIVPAGKSSGEVAVGGRFNTHIGIGRFEGKFVGSTGKQKSVITGREHSADIRVNIAGDSAEILLTLDGDLAAQWKGLQASISPSQKPQVLKHPFGFVMYDGQARFTMYRVHVLSGHLAAYKSNNSSANQPTE